MKEWEIDAATELTDILSLLLKGYFESKESLCDRIRTSTEAIEIVGSDIKTDEADARKLADSLTH